MKTLVRVPLSTYTGYGNDGIGLVQALMRWGADVYLDPTFVQAPLPEDVAFLLTKTLTPPFDLTISHLDPAALDSPEPMRRATKCLLAWTMWEYTSLSNLPGRSSLRRRLSRFDGILAYDAVTREAFEAKTSVPVAVLQGGFDPEPWEPVERDWFGDDFGFCMLGQLHSRKDPFVAIEAFRAAQRESPDFAACARLSLKTTVAGLHKGMEDAYPGVRIFYEIWPRARVRDFYAGHHVLLAPSRGEGKNMPALEFMSTGGTTIATEWGGHVQWLNPDYAYPLSDFSLVPVSPSFPAALQAKVSVTELRDLMLHTFFHRAEVKRKADLAVVAIPLLCSWDSVVRRLLESVIYKFPGGERVGALAAACRQEVLPVER